MPDLGRRPDATPDSRDSSRERRLLARKWAYLLLSTVFLPLKQDELERELLSLVDAVCDMLHTKPFSTRRAHEAGARLVEIGCTGDEALPCTVEVLGKGLLSRDEFQPTELFAERITLGLGALACGFAEANRRTTFEQQEDINLSLLKAVRDAKWNLRESEARFNEVALSSASGIMITDLDGRLVRVNAAIGDILRYSPAELEGTPLFDIVHPDYAAALRQDYQELLDGGKDRIKQSQRLLRKDGDVARISLTASLLHTGDQPSNFVTVVEDGTELMLLQGELNRQALHDVLTGLPNRQFFSSHLESALRRAHPVHGVTLFHLDLNAFAMICDGLGRQAGEQLLVHTGRQLKAVVAGEKAMVARIGGDEFGILVENSADTPSVETTVAGIQDKLSELVHVDGRGLAVSASIGVVHRPARDLDPAELLRAADLTLRRAKSVGRGQWGLFHRDQDARDRRNYTLAAVMPGAWESGQISATYRPMVCVADGQIVGVEAQLRWDHPDLGALPHERCVELAEQTGLILPLGQWLMRVTGQQVGWWRQQLVVGLTANQSSDADLVSRVVDVLGDTGLPAERLTVGIPVQAVSRSEAAENLRVLADIGVRTVLDDFGTAPDELAAVEDLPVRSARIARRLVERQARSTVDSPHTSALRALGRLVHQAGATVVVDGIRTQEQADWWREAGADSAMGDLFGDACSAGDMGSRLNT